MRKILIAGLAILGVLLVLAAVVATGYGIVSALLHGRVPEKTVLEADFEQGLVEDVPEDAIAQVLFTKPSTVRDVVEALEKASDDPRVSGLVARVGVAGLGLAQVQEIRDAVIAFRAKGKFARAYGETFGEFGPGNSAYYLATAFDEIDLQPSGDIGFTGLIAESPFIRGTLEKLGVTPRMDHRYEYKNAMNMYTERKYTEPHREAMKRLMDSWFGQIVRGIAKARKLSEEEVRALADRGPFLGKQALEAKLVDRMAYRDEVYQSVLSKAGQGAKLLYLSKYLERAGRPNTRGATVALIYGVGAVKRGESSYDPVFESASMGSDTVAKAFRAAIEDTDVKAILFRVDSPGGSYTASDTIWRETTRAKKAGKPVIVTMGNLAGSGGYFVAMAADKIVAQPGTITASIGVLGGKLWTSGFWDRLGLSWDEVHTSANSTMFTGTHDYTEAEWVKFQQWLDRVYADFTAKVAEGRRLPKEKVLQIAKGRIWTGEDALGLGLVDELGGFTVALRLARQSAGLAADAPVNIKVFPKKKSALEALLNRGPDSSDENAATATLAHVLQAVRPVLKVARQMGLASDPGVLAMPDVQEAR